MIRYRTKFFLLVLLAGSAWSAPVSGAAVESLQSASGTAQELMTLADQAAEEGRLQEAYQLLLQALSHFESLADRAGELEALIKLGDAAYSLGAAETAVPFYEKALPISRELGAPGQQGRALSGLGSTLQLLSRLEEAAELFRQALPLQELHDPFGATLSRIFLGQISLSQGDAGSGREYLVRAVEDSRASQDPYTEAIAVAALGMSYYIEKDSAGALPHLERSVRLAREIEDPLRLGTALSLVGSCFESLGRPADAVNALEEALPIQRGMNDPLGVASTQSSLARALVRLDRYPEAAESATAALEYYRSAGDLASQATELRQLGSISAAMDRHPEAIEYLNQALALYRQLGDRSGEATTLNNLGNSERSLSRLERAAELFIQARELRRQEGNLSAEAIPINNLGLVYGMQGNYPEAMRLFEEALEISREAGNHSFEATVVNNLGEIFRNLSQFETAVEYYLRALELVREHGERREEATTLNNLGSVFAQMSHLEESIDYLNQALSVAEETANLNNQATALNNLGNTYRLLGDYTAAARYLERALAIMQQVGNRASQAAAMNNLAECFRFASRIPEALEKLQETLSLARTIGLPSTEAIVLNNFGTIYTDLAEHQRASEYFEQALAILRRIGNRDGELRVLSNLGNSIRWTQPARAIELFEEALETSRSIGDLSAQGTILNNLGYVHQSEGDYQKALATLEDALDFETESGSRVFQGIILSNLGLVHRKLRQYQQAADHFRMALKITIEVKDFRSEAATLAGLMELWKEQGRTGLAIFYGKRAVNLYQRIRRGLLTLPQELQSSYLRSKEEVYRDLAGLLIQVNRLPEAQQVLRLLKEEEYSRFVRRGAADDLDTQAQLTQQEEVWEGRYQEISNQLGVLGQERSKLLRLDELSAEQEERLDALDADLIVAEQAFAKTLDQLHAAFTREERQERVIQVEEERGLMEDLRELGDGAVALYTLVGSEQLWTILISPDFRKARSYPISAEELSQQVFVFRDLLQDYTTDPRPEAGRLFEILVGELQEDLEQLEARTLMWSLDGALRYLPPAALWDGDKYLVERYRNVVYTPASKPRLKDPPRASWKALGLGVSEAHAPFSSLPGVKAELAALIREGEADVAGVLPGDIRMDQSFTRDTFRSSVLRRYPLLHIATHFMFRPGNEEDSFLLLGDGTRLSLSEIKRLPNVFGGVDLLTLSACETAVGGVAADGREIEGFGVLAQRQGAKAVLATLWKVADESTAKLMETFYQIRESENGISKGEALRLAQLSLLAGDEAAEADFRHPYFWAPFILIGNWQ